VTVNTRFRLTFLLPFVLLVAVANKCSAAADQEPSFSREHPRKLIFQTDWYPQAEHGGFYQAVVKGFYRDAGLEVTLVPGGPGAGATQRIARGEADIAMGRSDTVILAAVNQGLPLQLIAAITQHDYEALLIHDESPVHSFADLNGRTIIASPGQPWTPVLQKKLGITFNPDPAAIQQCIYTNEPFTARQHGVKVRILPIASAGYDVYTVLFCQPDFAVHNPAATRAFVAASLRGWRDYLEGDPTSAFAEILRRNPKLSHELLVFSRDEMIRHQITIGDGQKGEALGQLSANRLREQIAALTELKILTSAVEPDKIASWDYLPPEAK
jgi:NitT/TauT family transport system substrate-binding protein